MRTATLAAHEIWAALILDPVEPDERNLLGVIYADKGDIAGAYSVLNQHVRDLLLLTDRGRGRSSHYPGFLIATERLFRPICAPSHDGGTILRIGGLPPVLHEQGSENIPR